MTTHTHSVLHADHRLWQEEIEMWQIDLEEWEKERVKLLAELEVALGAEVSGLKNHAQTIEQQREKVLQHEQFLADVDRSLRPISNEIEARLADAHDQEITNHARTREAHERLKRFHHRAMAKLSVVLKSLDREM
jgi:ribosome-binding ATPase YchF (GTP1/OBG family)